MNMQYLLNYSKVYLFQFFTLVSLSDLAQIVQKPVFQMSSETHTHINGMRMSDQQKQQMIPELTFIFLH